MRVPLRPLQLVVPWKRCFSASAARGEIRNVKELPDRIIPRYQETRGTDLLSLEWPSPPRNILLVAKDGVPSVLDSLVEFAKHIHSTYPSIVIILEPYLAARLHGSVPFPIYTAIPMLSPLDSSPPSPIISTTTLPEKTDLTATLGGDGTILHATSLFSHTPSVPPILSFSLGTLGFLSEWKFSSHKRAFREVYMSGSSPPSHISGLSTNPSPRTLPFSEHSVGEEEVNSFTAGTYDGLNGWAALRGKILGHTRRSRVLLRNRLKVSIHSADSKSPSPTTHATNEVILHRGAAPHLTHIDISVAGRHLTTFIGDGLIVSTPTGSTAYSLSSGGSIIHPLVSSLLLTPICPRSLSFRPLVLPGHSPVSLRLGNGNRGREVEVSVDGQRRKEGIGTGMEVRIQGEEVGRERGGGGGWRGGVPCVMRGGDRGDEGDEGWVGGLNGLLKFNYPFGEE
ncbi:MAG: NADH kinase pos5 [Vezdaea acicularis]|nr:MAG: NADH kinase pos5 [Vezdaea acicularis]